MRSISDAANESESRSSISIDVAILEGARALDQAGVPESRREAGSLLVYTIGRDRTFILSHGEDRLDLDQLNRFREYVERRVNGEPLQYIIGFQDFFGLEFRVTTDVLIPRPETELLVETALRLTKDVNESPLICDVGTGSGCIAVALLHSIPGGQAVALDISAAALGVAEINARRHGVDDRMIFLVSDCFAALGDPALRFDLIVSNPPYVAGNAMAGLQREVREHEPFVALTPGSDGLLIIQRLLGESSSHLKRGGHLLMEIGFDQSAAVERLIDRNRWKLLDIHLDLQGIPRLVALQKAG